MRRNWIIGTLVVVLSGLSAGSLLAQDGQAIQQGPRRPRGIYAKVNISSEITNQQKLHPTITRGELSIYFNGLYQELLANPATSGLALQAHWDQLNPNPPGAAHPYDWTYVDDAFIQVSLWNTQNPEKPRKTIQFIITPGFQSPSWLLDQIPSCDGLFEAVFSMPPSTCGRVTFTGYLEEQDGDQLPLPWNPVYKNAWRAFLVVLNERYGSNPALVSIAVSGPTAASEEMIVPNDANTPAQTMFGNPPMPAPSIKPDDMWLALLAFHYPTMPAFQNSDQAFIVEWDAAIDEYEEIFSGLTLVTTTGSGLPNFNNNFIVPPVFADDCLNPNMDCAAETTILSYFADPIVGLFNGNAKATQTSGVEASRAGVTDLGLNGVKLLSQDTALFGLFPSVQILGGAQFNTSFSNNPVTEGSSSEPEQALFNVLQVIFDDTQVGGLYCETRDDAPLNYVQIYSNDFVYADGAGPAKVVEGDCGTVNVSAQEELNLASQRLLEIADPLPFFP